MAAITEFTSWNDAIAEPTKAIQIFTHASAPGSILIQLHGTPEFSVGDTITYINGGLKFSGKVWHIYRGTSSINGPVHNLYIKRADANEIGKRSGGMVYPGVYTPMRTAPSPSTSGPQYESAATILHQAKENEVIETPNGTTISAENDIPAPTMADVSAPVVAAAKSPKTILIVGAVVAAAYFLFKGKKK